jgi:hypothetical protein
MAAQPGETRGGIALPQARAAVQPNRKSLLARRRRIILASLIQLIEE